MKIRLNADERDVLLSKVQMPVHMRQTIESAPQVEDQWDVCLSEDDANDLRHECGKRWQQIGYDEVHGSTQIGYVLESLIDKLYAG
jgi:hypothetical protein